MMDTVLLAGQFSLRTKSKSWSDPSKTRTILMFMHARVCHSKLDYQKIEYRYNNCYDVAACDDVIGNISQNEAMTRNRIHLILSLTIA